MKKLIKASHPSLFFLSALTYSLGAGISHFLGKSTNLASFWLGLLTILPLQVSMLLFTEYFRSAMTTIDEIENPKQYKKFKITLLQVSFAALTLALVTLSILIVAHLITLSAVVFFVFAILLVVIYALPPFRLVNRGFGELVLAFIVGMLFPAFSFILQYEQMHRVLTFATFPIFLLTLAYLIVCDFPTFASDIKTQRNSILTRLTWARGIPMHHVLIATAYLLFAGSLFLGYPWGLVWPLVFTLPFAALQITLLQRVANGGSARWNLLIPLSLATLGLTVYMLTLTFWIR